MNRFLLITFYLFATVLLLNSQEANPEALKVDKQSPRVIKTMNVDFDKLGWKVGIQSYSFTKYSLFDAIDAAADLGLKYVEATTWQKIERNKDATFNPWWMSAEQKQKIKDKCNERGVRLISFYCRPGKEDIEKKSDQVEKIFQFCKEMNLILTTDPVRIKSGFGSMEFYDNLCQKYGVTMVLTNHPKSHGSPYWNPDDVLADLNGRSKYMGASVDIGHFMRDGTNVLETVKKYTDAGRMYHFHFRDVDSPNSSGKDVALGQGAAQIKELLFYMYQHGATPILVFEYERDQQEPLKYIDPSVNFLRVTAKELLKAGKKGTGKAAASASASKKFLARDAKIEGTLRIQDGGEEKATIHGWNDTNQKISWETTLKKGNYKVILRYSEPYSGGAVTVKAAGQQFAALLNATSNWQEYKSFELGVLKIENPGDNAIILQGTQLTLIKNKEGKLEHKEALPDIHWLELIPTNEKATSEPVDILKNFKGKKLFDGKTLKGWVGNNGEESFKWFRIEDNAIVGGTMEKMIPQNEFLRTDREYQDFELRYQFKMTFPEGTDSWNAGVQLRSKKHPKIANEMIGYQADILPWKWGAIWDEQRRWQFLGNQLQQPPHFNNGWNSEIVRCEGPRIRIWLNGVLTLDYTEPFSSVPHPDHGIIATKGYIALQLHEDKNPVEVRYKNIEIQELK